MRQAITFFLFSCIAALSGCGSGGGGVSDGGGETIEQPTPVVTTVTVSPAILYANRLGQRQQFTAAAATDVFGDPISDVAFTWESSSTSVAKVDATGLTTTWSYSDEQSNGYGGRCYWRGGGISTVGGRPKQYRRIVYSLVLPVRTERPRYLKMDISACQIFMTPLPPQPLGDMGESRSFNGKVTESASRATCPGTTARSPFAIAMKNGPSSARVIPLTSSSKIIG